MRNRRGGRLSSPRALVLAATLAAGVLAGAWSCGPRLVATGRQDPALDSLTPRLTRDLTPELARRRLGDPDVETGSGLIIYGYRLTAGRTLWLGFPGHEPIVYAQLEERDGSRRPLPVR